ncbi:MAG: hypothetical protein HMLKMBBP_02266 [Planctomycetes bacterium]|nr:hypothetical protein [Planctomycetota bacterium]
MKVAIVARPGIGGAARVIEALLRRLPDRGISGTAILSGTEGTALLNAAAAHGWRVERLDMSRGVAWSDRAALGRIAELIPGHDLVHAHASKAGALARLAAGAVPVVYAPHGLYFTYHAAGSWRRGFWRALERRLAPRTALFHCVSEAEAEECVAAGLCAPERAVAVTNPVPPRGPAEEAPSAILGGKLVLMAARLADPKDPVGYFTAARRVDPSLDARFVLCGDGDLLVPARRASEHVPGGKAWVLTGVKDVRGLLRRARLAVLATRSEALPVFLAEAMTEGVPVVASDVPGCRAACGRAALYAPPGDDAAMAAAIERLLRDGALHAELSAEARARAPLFDEDRWIGGIVAMYERAVTSRRRP